MGDAFALPDRLVREASASESRWDRPWAAGDLVRALVAPWGQEGFDEIRLVQPPFRTLAELSNSWFERFRHPDQIDFERAVVFGDWGVGSDDVLVLDFRSGVGSRDVPVMTLVFRRTPDEGGHGHHLEGTWVEIAKTFDDLVRRIGV